MKAPRWNPFRPRNAIGGALVLGILAGIWLGELFKGFGLGLGPESQESRVESQESESQEARDKIQEPEEHAESSLALDSRPSTLDSTGPVHVLIDDRSYFVRDGEERREIELPALVQLIERTIPNEDGLKAVVNRTPASRTTVENRLFAALKEAGISKSAVYMPEQAVE